MIICSDVRKGDVILSRSGYTILVVAIDEMIDDHPTISWFSTGDNKLHHLILLMGIDMSTFAYGRFLARSK